MTNLSLVPEIANYCDIFMFSIGPSIDEKRFLIALVSLIAEHL